MSSVCKVVCVATVIGPAWNQRAHKTVCTHISPCFDSAQTNSLFVVFALTVFCKTPPIIEHARHSALPEQLTFELDSTVQYHCHTGYVTAGFPRAKCLAIDGQASWYGPDIQCEPRSCGQPPDPSHGWHAGECYTFGCRITHHCSEGYELVGKSERFCQATGDWAPKELPTCVRKYYLNAIHKTNTNIEFQ